MTTPRLTRPPERTPRHRPPHGPKTVAVLEAAVAVSDLDGMTCLSRRTLARQLRCSTLDVGAAVLALERAGALVRLSDGVHALAGTAAAAEASADDPLEDDPGAVAPRAPSHAAFLLDLRSPPW